MKTTVSRAGMTILFTLSSYFIEMVVIVFQTHQSLCFKTPSNFILSSHEILHYFCLELILITL